MKGTPEVRFWAKVQKTDTCWLWTAATVRGGYGVFEGAMAHRRAYEALVGPIPDGLELDHLCRVRNCVNPTHLEPVTHAENVGRRPVPTHCPAGHEYTPANTRWRISSHPSSRRPSPSCRACDAARARATRIRRKAAAAGVQLT